MGNRVGLDRLLDLEDDPAFLELVCPTTGVLAWPAIRADVFRLLLGDRLYGTAPLVDLERRADLRRVAAGAFRAVIHNQRHPPRQSDVLLLATGAGLIPRDGRSFNRYTDHFADILGDGAWTMESLFGDDWPTLPRANRRLGFLADQRLELAIRGRTAVRAVHRELAQELVALAARHGRDRLGWDLGDSRRRFLVTSATRGLANYPARARSARRLLRRVRPRLVLVEEGCYGHMAVFNTTARELGVTVAEFQHGMVTRGHDAYNVAPRLAASPAYQLTQPTAFLGYGSWWNDQFNAPVEERVVVATRTGPRACAPGGRIPFERRSSCSEMESRRRLTSPSVANSSRWSRRRSGWCSAHTRRSARGCSRVNEPVQIALDAGRTSTGRWRLPRP